MTGGEEKVNVGPFKADPDAHVTVYKEIPGKPGQTEVVEETTLREMEEKEKKEKK